MRFGRLVAGFLSVALAMSAPHLALAAGHAHKTAHKKPVATHGKAVKTPPIKAVSKARKAAPVEEADFDGSGNPLIRSSAFYVQDVNTGEVLLQKNSSAPLPIASITKLMTSMVVLDAHQNLNEVLEISEDDVDRLKSTSSRLGVGTRMSREELMHLALMASENRAASALARNYPGGMAAFLEAMNVKARLMGLHETRFFDGTGLTKNNVSSAARSCNHGGQRFTVSADSRVFNFDRIHGSAGWRALPYFPQHQCPGEESGLAD